MNKNYFIKQILIGAILGFFYYVLKQVMRPLPNSGFLDEASQLAVSIVVGILIYMIIVLLRAKKPD